MKKQSLFYVVLVVLSLFLAINTNVLSFEEPECGVFEECYYTPGVEPNGHCIVDHGTAECDTNDPQDCNYYQMLYCCLIDSLCEILDK